MKKTELLVIGGGAWGTALANVLALKNFVDLVAIEKEVCHEINTKHTNSTFFKKKLRSKIKAINAIPLDLSQYKMIVISTPTYAVLSVAKTLCNNNLANGVIIVNTSKGFEPSTNQIMSVALKQLFSGYSVKVASLMGPGFASEVVKNYYTAVNSIADDIETAQVVQQYFANDFFRVYTSTDLIGAEICSALKNVIAIASGIIDGLGYKNNTRAALITRGLKEIFDYSKQYNCDIKTFFGLCGIGDLTLTCSTTDSRNFKLGYEIGKKKSAAFLADYKQTVEGVNTTKVIFQTKGNIEMPILEAVYAVLFLQANPEDIILALMRRELKSEFSGRNL